MGERILPEQVEHIGADGLRTLPISVKRSGKIRDVQKFPDALQVNRNAISQESDGLLFLLCKMITCFADFFDAAGAAIHKGSHLKRRIKSKESGVNLSPSGIHHRTNQSIWTAHLIGECVQCGNRNQRLLQGKTKPFGTSRPDAETGKRAGTGGKSNGINRVQIKMGERL